MAKSIALTTELSSLGNLTELYAQSGLTADLHIPRTIKLSESFNRTFFFQAPSNRETKSKIWQFGHALAERHSGSKHWLCGLCYALPRPFEVTLAASATNRAFDHLREAHSIDKDGLTIG
jgi:hypothetical protein